MYEDTANVARAPGSLRFLDVLLVVVATVAVVLGANLALRGFPLTLTFVLATLLLQSAVMLAVVYVFIVQARGIGWRDIGLRAVSRPWVLGAFVIALITVPVVSGINLAVQALLGTPFRNPQLDLFAPADATWTAFAGTVLVVAIVAPFAEEIVFRGLFYGWLRKHLGAPLSIAISAAIFAAAHGIPVLAPALLVQGAILAAVYERSASLWPPFIIHATTNGIMVAALYAAIAAGMAPEFS